MFFESIQIVTGPSLTSSTCMSAPNSPVATPRPSNSATRAVNRARNGFGGRLDITRPVALAGRGLQRELAHDQNFAACLHHVEVHHPGFIVEDTQPHEFSGEVLDVLVGVVAPDAEQHQQSRPDPEADIAADSDGSVFYTLNEQSHGRDIQRFSK